MKNGKKKFLELILAVILPAALCSNVAFADVYVSDGQSIGVVLPASTRSEVKDAKAAEIRVMTTGGTREYDGTPFRGGVFVEGLPEGFAVLKAETNEKDYALNVDDGEITVHVGELVIVNSDGEDVTDQLDLCVIEEATVSVLPRKVTIASGDAIKTYDGTPLKEEEAFIVEGSFIAPDSFHAEITGSQTLIGSSENTFTVEILADGKEINYDVTLLPGELEVVPALQQFAGMPEELDPTLVVSMSCEDKDYTLNEPVSFTISVTNIYAEPMTATLNGVNGLILDQMVITDIAPGETVFAEGTYVITEDDVEEGSCEPTVSVELGDFVVYADVLVFTVEPQGSLVLTVKETAQLSAGKVYALGETVLYSVTAENTGNIELTDIRVTNSLNGEELQLELLHPGEAHELVFSYVVTEADILRGAIRYSFTCTAEVPEGVTSSEIFPAVGESSTEAVKGRLTITESANTPDNGRSFTMGETIRYSIYVENTGNITLSNVVITDELSGESLFLGSIAPGKTATANTQHVVSHEDTITGYVRNKATATAENPAAVKESAPAPEILPGETEVPVAANAISVFVRQQWDDQGDIDGLRPNQVTVRLLADGSDTGKILVLQNGSWEGWFTDLPEAADGKRITYTVTAEPVVEYSSTVSGTQQTGYLLTSVHEREYITVSGFLNWHDGDNRRNTRPVSVTVRLYEDGREIAARVITEADGWAWNFGSFPVFRNGSCVEYTIGEDAVPGYYVLKDGFNITNSTTPRTGDGNSISLAMFGFVSSLAALGSIGIAMRGKRGKNRDK